MITKKAQATFILISILISLVGFFIILHFFTSTTSNIESPLEAAACKSLISTYGTLKNSTAGKAAEFFVKISLNCKVLDHSNTKVTSQDEMFQNLADEMKTCWNKYDQGQSDFMNSFSTDSGNYCFLCAKVSYDASQLSSTQYTDFIDWTQNNVITLKDGSKVSYYNYINMKYVDFTPEDKTNLEQGITDLQNLEQSQPESSDDLGEIKNYLLSQNQFLNDLNHKVIAPNTNLYVVYRYDKPQKTLDDIINNYKEQELTSLGVGLVASAATGILLSPFTMGTSALAAFGRIGGILLKANKAKTILTSLSTISKVVKFSTLAKVSLATGTAAGVTASYTYNTNNFQYVDVLTQEQYYRECGTLPVLTK